MRLFRKSNSPYWYYQFDLNGKRHRSSTRRTSKTEARVVADAIYRKVLDRTQLGLKDDITLAEAAEDYLRHMERRCSSHNSYTAIVGRVRRIIGGGRITRPSLDPQRDLASLTQADVETMRRSLEAEGLKPASINKVTQALKGIVSYHEPTHNVPSLTYPCYRTTAKLRYCLPGEEQKLLNEIKVPLVRELTMFLLDTGVRVSEALDLTWDCVSWNGRTVRVYRSKTDTVDEIGLTDRVYQALRQRYDTPGASHPTWIYAGKDGPLDRSLHALRNAIRRAGLNDPRLVKQYGSFTIHSLRHTFATKLVQRGMDLYGVQRLLGHTSPEMTQRYAKLRASDVAQRAVNLLQDMED